MKFPFKQRQEARDEQEAMRRLRYAVIGMMDATGGDREWVTDVVEMAEYDWKQVNK